MVERSELDEIMESVTKQRPQHNSLLTRSNDSMTDQPMPLRMMLMKYAKASMVQNWVIAEVIVKCGSCVQAGNVEHMNMTP